MSRDTYKVIIAVVRAWDSLSSYDRNLVSNILGLPSDQIPAVVSYLKYLVVEHSNHV